FGAFHGRVYKSSQEAACEHVMRSSSHVCQKNTLLSGGILPTQSSNGKLRRSVCTESAAKTQLADVPLLAKALREPTQSFCKVISIRRRFCAGYLHADSFDALPLGPTKSAVSSRNDKASITRTERP